MCVCVCHRSCLADADTEKLGHNGEYTGPVFDELGEEVQDGFAAYLESLGVNFEFASAVFQYAEWKEGSEYRRWLSSVKQLVE